MANSSLTADPPPGATRMLYLRRDAQGQIASVKNVADHEHAERCPLDNPELRSYLQLPAIPPQQLEESDAHLVRVIDDLIETLIRKQVISITDLPQAAQDKLLNRRRLRDALSHEALLGADDSPV